MISAVRLQLAARLTRALFPVLLVSCAGQAPPPGGPEDRIPPEVISSVPAPNATFVSEKMIVLEFSEYVNRRSVEGAIFVSPDVGPLEFDWSGREVEITFSDSLKTNTTYVVTVGTDVTDLRNNNRMARALSLAFSTGPEIDRGGIAGIVYPESMNSATSGVLVGAYRLDGLDADTLNPRWTKPDYVTQTGVEGGFSLPHLRIGRYRLLALRDEYRNLVYDPETDAFGVVADDVQLTESDTLVRDVAIRLAVEDTSGPTLIKVTAKSRRLVEVEFSEALQELSVPGSSVDLRDTLSGTQLEVLAMTVELGDRTRYMLATTPQDSDAVYRLTVTGVQDSSGNQISPIANSLAFQGSPAVDTAAFQVKGLSVRDSSRSVPFRPTMEITFNRPSTMTLGASSVRLTDTLGRQLPLELAWKGSLILTARPQRALSSEAWYRLSVLGGDFGDIFGARGEDTTVTVSFQVVSADRLGSIEGIARDDNPVDTVGSFVVLALEVEGKSGGSVTTTINGPGPFVLADVPEGKYRIGGFRDRNRNNLYDPGSVFPYRPSERYRLVPDTLRVRARWPYEGAVVRLR